MSDFNVIRGRKKPGRPSEAKSRQVTLRLRPDVVRAVNTIAAELGISKSGVVENALTGNAQVKVVLKEWKEMSW